MGTEIWVGGCWLEGAPGYPDLPAGDVACRWYSIALASIPLKSVFNYTDFLTEVLLTSLEEDGWIETNGDRWRR